jgi:hypothetical protein
MRGMALARPPERRAGLPPQHDGLRAALRRQPQPAACERRPVRARIPQRAACSPATRPGRPRRWRPAQPCRPPSDGPAADATDPCPLLRGARLTRRSLIRCRLLTRRETHAGRFKAGGRHAAPAGCRVSISRRSSPVRRPRGGRRQPGSVGPCHVASPFACSCHKSGARRHKELSPLCPHRQSVGRNPAAENPRVSRGSMRGERRDSNPRPPGPQPGASRLFDRCCLDSLVDGGSR